MRDRTRYLTERMPSFRLNPPDSSRLLPARSKADPEFLLQTGCTHMDTESNYFINDARLLHHST